MLRVGTSLSADADSLAPSGPGELRFLGGGGGIGDVVAEESVCAASSVVFWSSDPVDEPGSASGCLGGGGPMAVVIVSERVKREGNWKWEVKALMLAAPVASFDGDAWRFCSGERPDVKAMRDDLATGRAGFGPYGPIIEPDESQNGLVPVTCGSCPQPD